MKEITGITVDRLSKDQIDKIANEILVLKDDKERTEIIRRNGRFIYSNPETNLVVIEFENKLYRLKNRKEGSQVEPFYVPLIVLGSSIRMENLYVDVVADGVRIPMSCFLDGKDLSIIRDIVSAGYKNCKDMVERINDSFLNNHLLTIA